MSTELKTQESTPKTQASQASRRPYYTVDGNKDHYTVDVYMPGVSKGDYNVSLQSNELVVEGKKVIPLPTGAQWLHREISPEPYRLRLQLNLEVDADAITARSEDGILRIKLPLAKEARPRRIKIQ